MQKHSLYPKWFPIPYFTFIPNNLYFKALGQEWENVYLGIVYEYIEEEKIGKDNKNKLEMDIMEQIYEIHRMGLVHGDVRRANIIKTEKRYLLIDYGRTYTSHGNISVNTFTLDKYIKIVPGYFRPLLFMLEDDNLITQEDDLNELDIIISRL